MNSFKQKLESGIHIISLPIDKEYKLDELFDSDLTGSFIEELNLNGTFTRKEKILFENNEFIVSSQYKRLKPFETIRLTLKRPININWQISFKSNSFIKKEELKIIQGYDKNKSLQLMQLCKLVYDNESDIEQKVLSQYKFDDFFYFSKQSHKYMMKKGFFKLFYTFFKSKTNIVDLQFMKLSRYDESIDKNIIVLIFQGSQEAEDWMTNLSIKRANYFGREEVHKGFYNSLKLFLRTVKNKEFETKDNKKFRFNKDIDFINDNCKLILAGHSLGGAVATLAGCYFHDLGIKKENMTIYTFGAPPVGCEEFCSIYRKKLNLYRVVNEKDVVPKIDKLTNLRHLGKEIQLISNENEIHSCTGYIDNLIDELN
jgi:hypothetical protein